MVRASAMNLWRSFSHSAATASSSERVEKLFGCAPQNCLCHDLVEIVLVHQRLTFFLHALSELHEILLRAQADQVWQPYPRVLELSQVCFREFLVRWVLLLPLAPAR